MKCTFIMFLGALLFVAAATPQDIPADRILLGRVLRQVEQESKRQSNVSCLETVSREHQPKHGRMKPLDTVRLEVLTNGKIELYASPGDRNFSENPPIDWAGSGALGTGFFGLYLGKLSGSNASFAWKGEEDRDARHLARWDYQIPLASSGQTFVLQDGSGAVSLHGSVWADPMTADVVRLEMSAGDIPETLPLFAAGWSIDYAPTSVSGNLTVLLPQTADFSMVKVSGEASRDQFAFTQCRTFAAETSLSFNESNSDGPARFAASDVDDNLRPLPSGLEIPVKLTTRISAGMAVGALIDGVVPKDVLLKRQLVIPAGSAMRGRIRRLERYSEPRPYFTVAIEYTELSVEGIRYRFDADLTRIDPGPGIEQTIASQNLNTATTIGAAVVNREVVRYSDLPGVATFFFPGLKLNVPDGLQTIWNTQRKPGRDR